MTKRYFGTDGIRGYVGRSLINPEFVLKLGWAAGKVFASQGKGRVLIGKDTRVSGYMLESALEAGLVAAGASVRLCGPMPTPAVAYLTRTLRDSAGIVISASHNPFYDNGIKFFSPQGFKLGDETERLIEHYLEQPMEVVGPSEIGKTKRIDDAPGRYIEFCKGTFPSELTLDGLKIVVDCANGATYHVAPRVFHELGAEVIRVGAEPDGFNINQHCGSTHPEGLQQLVIAHQADLGIAFDGDGDRVLMVDHLGRLVDGDQLLYCLAQDVIEFPSQHRGIVGTVMSNLGLEKSLLSMGIPFKRANVGDRYVMELLHDSHWWVGGEPSGHVVSLRHTSTGDGIIIALQVLHVMLEAGENLADLVHGMEKYPQILINVPLKSSVRLTDYPRLLAEVEVAQQELGQQGRILLRPSGTESLMRVMAEGEDEHKVRRVAERLAEAVLRNVHEVTSTTGIP